MNFNLAPDFHFDFMLSSIIEQFICIFQGNQQNQAVIFDHKICDYINHILRVGQFKGCGKKEVRKGRKHKMLRKMKTVLSDILISHDKFEHQLDNNTVFMAVLV